MILITGTFQNFLKIPKRVRIDHHDNFTVRIDLNV